MLLASAIAFSGSSAPGGDSGQSEPEIALRKGLEAFRNQGGFPGAVAAFYRTDGSLVTWAVGLADRDRKTPMPLTARMLAGSAGKTFFAALALQLAGEGKVKLDTPVKEYLGREPWFGRLANGEHITARMLMNHTSGLPGLSRQFMSGLVKNPLAERSH